METPLVLLPGLLSNESLWQHQIDHLGDIASIQVIPARQDTAEKMIQEILDLAPAQFALAGHSMGGWLCLEVMKVAAFRVTRLCLLNTTGRMDSREKRERRQELILRAESNFPAIVSELVEHFVYNASVKSAVGKMFLEVGKEVFIHQQLAMMKRSESQSVLSHIMCPTLVIHAAQDKNFSLLEHQELVDQIPHAKLALCEDAGHMSPMEMPQAITALLRLWLTYFTGATPSK